MIVLMNQNVVSKNKYMIHTFIIGAPNIWTILMEIMIHYGITLKYPIFYRRRFIIKLCYYVRSRDKYKSYYILKKYVQNLLK